MRSDNLKNQFHLHVIVFIWGFTALLGALISLSALPLVWTRILIGVSFVGLYMLLRQSSFRFPVRTKALFLVSGFVIALHWVTFFHAIKISNISITLACLSTGAFFTSILEPIFYKRKIIWYEVVLGCVVVFGLLLIFQFETEYIWGILTALLSALLSASFALINGKLVHRYDALGISFYELLGGLLFLTALLVVTGGFTASHFHFQKFDVLWLLVLGSVCTAYPFIVNIKIMKYLSPYTVMLTINLEPIYGIILALLIFKNEEKMTPAFYLGACIILSTVVLNAYFKNRVKRRTKLMQ